MTTRIRDPGSVWRKGSIIIHNHQVTRIHLVTQAAVRILGLLTEITRFHQVFDLAPHVWKKEITSYYGIDHRNSKVAILFMESLDDFLGQHLGKSKFGSAVTRLYKNEYVLMDPRLVI
jgi:hypothetical protein